jgi:hypothetical protein
MVPVTDKQAFKLKVSPELRQKLDEAAEKFSKESANAIAVEIIREYFPLWLDHAERYRRFLDKQREGIVSERNATERNATERTEVLRFKTRAKHNKLRTAKSKRANSD